MLWYLCGIGHKLINTANILKVKVLVGIYMVNIKAGEVFTERNVRSIRPGYGLAPKHLPLVLDRRAVRALNRGTPLSAADVDPALDIGD